MTVNNSASLNTECNGVPYRCIANETLQHNVPSSPTDMKPEQGAGDNRMLMRDWLEREADSGTMNGLQWLNRDEKLVKISWKHGSKSGWSKEDCEVFVQWAKYTGFILNLTYNVSG